MMAADAAAAPQASGEYHAYNLPAAGSLPQGSVQRLPLVDGARRHRLRTPLRNQLADRRLASALPDHR